MNDSLEQKMYEILDQVDPDEKDALFKAINSFYEKKAAAEKAAAEEQKRQKRVEITREKAAIALASYLEAMSGNDWDDDYFNRVVNEHIKALRAAEKDIKKWISLMGSTKENKSADDIIKEFLAGL
jgi:hypothetical protein